MAGEIIQKRIFELVEYDQKIPTEPGYEDPSAVFIAVDKSDWTEAKKMQLLEFAGQGATGMFTRTRWYSF